SALATSTASRRTRCCTPSSTGAASRPMTRPTARRTAGRTVRRRRAGRHDRPARPGRAHTVGPGEDPGDEGGRGGEAPTKRPRGPGTREMSPMHPYFDATRELASADLLSVAVQHTVPSAILAAPSTTPDLSAVFPLVVGGLAAAAVA